MASRMADSAIFVEIQKKIDGDTKFRDELREITQDLEKHTRVAQAKLQIAHSTPKKDLKAALESRNFTQLEQALSDGIKQISIKASEQPYYRWNQQWSKVVQDAVLAILLKNWIVNEELHTPEQLSSLLGVPVGGVTEDNFHISTEEYLLAVISLIEELSRLARNSVTIGDYQRPVAISQFVKDIHAGFQTLNLKNDILRKRSDGIKYRLKDVEDVVYDLSLRNLLPKENDP